MKPVKKIEIVADAVAVPAIVRALESAGVSGYTVIRDVAGHGERGDRSADELTGALTNSYIMTACDADVVDRVVAAIRPFLQRAGGIALVSDAQWVLH